MSKIHAGYGCQKLPKIYIIHTKKCKISILKHWHKTEWLQNTRNQGDLFMKIYIKKNGLDLDKTYVP